MSTFPRHFQARFVRRGRVVGLARVEKNRSIVSRQSDRSAVVLNLKNAYNATFSLLNSYGTSGSVREFLLQEFKLNQRVYSYFINLF